MIETGLARVTFVRAMIALSIITLVGAVYSLLGAGSAAPDTTWQRLQQDRVLVVGIDISFPPFGLVEDNTAQGIDADLARALADALGFTVRFVPLSFDGMYDALLTGNIDVLIAALRPEPQREGVFRYTDPYFDAGYVFVATNAAPEQFSELYGQRLAVPFATEADEIAQQSIDDSVELRQLLSVDDIIEAVGTGSADVGLLDAVSAYEALRAYPSLQISTTRVIHDHYVIAVRHSDWKLYHELQQALDRLQAHGDIADILRRWL